MLAVDVGRKGKYLVSFIQNGNKILSRWTNTINSNMNKGT